MKYLLSLLLLCGACSSISTKQAQFKTEYLHAQPGSISILSTKTATLFEVESEFGIGKAKVELLSGHWPAHSIVRLHLKALEGFSLSGSGNQFELPDLQISRVESKDEVYFDVVLPERLLKNTDEIYFTWVDYYR